MVSNNGPHVGTQHQDPNLASNSDISGADGTFEQELRNMSKATLNGLRMADYTRKQRHLIDQERCRRSNARKAAGGANNQANSVPSLPAAPVVSSEAITITPVAAPVPSTSHETHSRPTNDRPKISYLFPEHHNSISRQVPGVRFQNADVDGVYEWPTNILGSFKCSKKKCKKEWNSGVVATLIRKYHLPGDKLAYNAKVFNQRCKRCESLGYLTINQDVYIERVVRRLKIWRNEPVERILEYLKKTPPHEVLLCEGCNAGCCQRE